MLKSELENKSPIYSSYNRGLRWLGIIEYKSLVILLVYMAILFVILKSLSITFEIKIYIFSFLFTPVFLFFALEMDNQNSSDAIIYMLKFIVSRGIYVKDTKVAKEYVPNIYAKNKEYAKTIVKK